MNKYVYNFAVLSETKLALVNVSTNRELATLHDYETIRRDIEIKYNLKNVILIDCTK